MSPPPRLTLQSALEEAPLDRRYWTVFAVACTSSTIDFFDFFIAGFLLSVLAPLWKLSYGETSIILLGGGAGSIVGSLLGGLLCDSIGRRPIVIGGSFACAIASGLVAFIPDGAWGILTALRFVTGLTLSAVFTGVIALIVERTPTRHRTTVSSLAFIAPSAGVLLATLTSALMLELLGWRGVALLGALPLIPAILAAVLLPESIPWLLSTGRIRRARELAERQLGHSVRALVTPRDSPAGRAPGYRQLLDYRRAFWLVVLIWFGAAAAIYGIYAWGPTIISQELHVRPQTAARFFILVPVAGVCGKIIYSIVPRWLGRRRTGQVTMTLAGLSMVLAACAPTLMPANLVFGVPLFLLLLAFCACHGEGGGAGMSPYSAEVFPVHLAARGAGLGQAAAGIGKILGPVSLGVIAGTSHLVTPEATHDAILPGFLFLAGCFLVAALAYTVLGIETHGRALQICADERTVQTAQRARAGGHQHITTGLE